MRPACLNIKTWVHAQVPPRPQILRCNHLRTAGPAAHSHTQGSNYTISTVGTPFWRGLKRHGMGIRGASTHIRTPCPLLGGGSKVPRAPRSCLARLLTRTKTPQLTPAQWSAPNYGSFCGEGKPLGAMHGLGHRRQPHNGSRVTRLLQRPLLALPAR